MSEVVNRPKTREGYVVWLEKKNHFITVQQLHNTVQDVGDKNFDHGLRGFTTRCKLRNRRSV